MRIPSVTGPQIQDRLWNTWGRVFAVAVLMGVLQASVLLGREAILFSNLGSEEGIPQNGVLSLAEDRMGLVWFGTHDGVLQFDGYNLTAYGSREDRPGAAFLRVQTLQFDGRRHFLAGTSEGLQQFDSTMPLRGLRPQSGSDDPVAALARDPHTGHTWLGTVRGLRRWEPQSGAMATLGVHQSVTALFFEPEDATLWVGTAAGDVFRCNRSDPEQLELWWPGTARIHALVQSPQGDLWVGTEGSGLYCLSPEREVTHFTTGDADARGLPSNRVTCLLVDHDGQLWVGTSNGLCRYEAVSKRFRVYRHHPDDTRSLGSNEIQCLFEDRRRVLWVGHRAGVSRFGLDHEWFAHYRHLPGEPSSLGHDAVFGMALTGDGRLWIGTAGGLYSFTGDGFLHHSVGEQPAITPPNIFVLQADSQENLWIGTRDQGLLRWEIETNQTQSFYHNSADPASLPHNAVTALAIDKQERLWVGTSDGLARQRPDSGFIVFRHEPGEADSLPGNLVSSLYVDQRDAVLIGVENGGVHVFDEPSGGFHPLDEQLGRNTVTVMTEDSKGRLWLGTRGDGVYAYHRETKSAEHYHTDNSSLPGNVVHGIVEDQEGHLWLSTEDGLARYLEQGQFRIFDLDDGLQSMAFHPRAYGRDAQGRLYFGGSQGLNVIDLQTLPNRRVARQPILTGLEINGQLIQASPDNPYLQKPLGLIDVLELPFDKRSRVAFRFATLDYTVPTPSEFRFRLMPMEEIWTHAGKERRASYTGIPPGKYTLEVQASLGGDHWNVNSAFLDLRILPPWYLRWEAIVAFVLGGVALISLVLISWFRRQHRRILRQSEKLENQRNRAEAALANELQRAMVLSSTAESPGDHSGVLYEKTLACVTDYFDAASGGIFQWTPDQKKLALTSQRMERESISLEGFDASNSLVQHALESGDTLAIDDVENDSRMEGERDFVLRSGIRALMLLRTSDQGVGNGLLMVADTQPRHWETEDIQLMETVALQVGRAMKHHHLLLEEQRIKVDLQATRRAAEEANQAKSDFLAKMTHELRTPLNSIIGFTQLLNDDLSLPEDHRETLNIINASGMHLLETVNGILDMSKIEQGQMELHEGPFQLHPFIEDVARMMRMRAESAGVTVEVERSGALPERIEADKVKLRQTLINFLGNAIKFTPKGGQVYLRVKFAGAPAPEGSAYEKPIRLHFEVADTGCGIAEHEIHRLFEKFTQTASGRHSGQGTGLGLPISKSFIELMGGQVEVHSQLKKGTVFSFDILCGQLETDTAANGAPAKDHANIPRRSPDAGEFRILIAEDQLANRLLLRTLLDKAGFTVFEAANGKEAVEAWNEWHPQLIFMDNDMPLMNGMEATREIVRRANGNRPTIIFLSAYAIESYRQEAILAGCADYLTKPFDKQELFEVIARHTPAAFEN